jgi:hypothetical protein
MSTDTFLGISDTADVISYRFLHNGFNFMLVDTPGFDDTYLSDRDVLTKISEWLASSYRAGTKLSAIIYLHRISDPRMQGSALRNFTVFKKLCGEDCFRSVFLCTTFWDMFKRNPGIAEAREAELKTKEEFWGGMISRGSKVCRVPNNQESARQLLCAMVQGKSLTLKIQRELVDEEKKLDDTAAGLSFFELEMGRMKEEHERQRQELEQRFKEKLREKEEEVARQKEALKKAYEEKLATQDHAKDGLQQEKQQKMELELEHRESWKRDVEEMRLKRIQTEEKIKRAKFQNQINARKQRLDQFVRNVSSTMNLLTTGKQNRHVKCDFNGPKDCYLAVCHSCLKNVGRHECYGKHRHGQQWQLEVCSLNSVCKLCTDGFNMCTACYQNSDIACNDLSHQKISMTRALPTALPISCPRANNPPQNRPLFCSKCKQNVGICYLRKFPSLMRAFSPLRVMQTDPSFNTDCCHCSEAFDMCINCALKGRYCPGHGRSFPRTPHRLEVGCRNLTCSYG